MPALNSFLLDIGSGQDKIWELDWQEQAWCTTWAFHPYSPRQDQQ